MTRRVFYALLCLCLNGLAAGLLFTGLFPATPGICIVVILLLSLISAFVLKRISGTSLPPCLLVVILLNTMLCLGVWQLQRLHWKEEILAHISAQMNGPPADLDALALTSPLPDLDYRPVRLSGRFLNLGTLHMPARVHEGQVGWHVLQYFEQDTGRIWLVNRGWLPQEQLEAWSPTFDESQPLTLTGIARTPHPPGRFTPASDPGRNLWYTYDPPAMFRAAELTAPLLMEAFLARTEPRYVIEADTLPGDGQPAGGVTLVDIPNNHWQYALTWFALAGTLLAVYAVGLAGRNRPAS